MGKLGWGKQGSGLGLRLCAWVALVWMVAGMMAPALARLDHATPVSLPSGPQIATPAAPLRNDVLAPRDRSSGEAALESGFRRGGWRCEAVCDGQGHLRQRCLTLEDPRLSGMGQALDHLSKAPQLRKSLDDLGIDPETNGPSC